MVSYLCGLGVTMTISIACTPPLQPRHCSHKIALSSIDIHQCTLVRWLGKTNQVPMHKIHTETVAPHARLHTQGEW